MADQQFIHRAQYTRTYLESDWADEEKRAAYIQEARDTAQAQRPAEVTICVTERHGRKGIRRVRVIAH